MKSLGTTVTFWKRSDGALIGYTANGHSGYAEAGADIVCAAISVLVINTMNAIEAFTDDETSLVSDEVSGKIDFLVKGNPSKGAQLLLDAMLLGLEDMADDEIYRNYMDLTYEEV